MATNAICGRTCSVVVGSETLVFHNAQLQVDGIETDVTAFGSGAFGDWVTCGASATLNAGTYENLMGVLDAGDEVSVVLTLGYSTAVTVTCAAKVQSIGVDADAKGVVMQTVVFRLTGDPVVAPSTPPTPPEE